jgi:lipopolysaccharide cholinephosphotransferase
MDDLSLYNPEGSILRRAQMRMVEILDVFDAICRKHNINYWLVWGTLLGARRHRGFIPWDDDVDVAVLQSDFKKLLSVLEKELPENLKLQARGTDKNYWYFFAKIRDTNSRYYDRMRFNYQGIFIDIFPIEPVPSIRFKKMIEKFLFSENNFMQAKSLFRKSKYGLMRSFLPLIRFIIMLSRNYYKYINRTKNYTFAYGVFYYAKLNMKYFLPTSEINFEGKKYKAPHNPDGYLIDTYGPNFMEIPKVSNRKTHSTKIEFL